MKIDNSTKPAGTALLPETRAHGTSKAALPTGDAVQLSPLSAQLVDGDDQPFDAARVSEIKQAIANGGFTINAGAIADRLIDSARELVDAQRQV